MEEGGSCGWESDPPTGTVWLRRVPTRLAPAPERVSNCTLAAHCVLSHSAHTTPSKVMPYRLTPSVASGRPLTGLGRMHSHGSGNHLMRAFAGSKPLLDRTPYCLCPSG